MRSFKGFVATVFGGEASESALMPPGGSGWRNGAARTETTSAIYRPGDFLIPEWQIVSVLGEGGLGIVYLVCNDLGDGDSSTFALKTYQDALLGSAEARAAFKKEAETWIALGSHPHIARARELCSIAGRLFLEVEYVPPNLRGLGSLEDYFRRDPPDLAQSLRWAIQICRGMEYCYGKGLRAHRDLKPANILISQMGVAKITDFGLASALVQPDGPFAAREDLTSGRVGLSCSPSGGGAFGTPTHMSPEQFAHSSSCDERSDLYSIGVVLYQLAAGGDVPFLAPLPVDRSATEALRFWDAMHTLHENGRVPSVDSPLAPLIERCLAKRPKKRYQTFAELREDLEALLLGLTGEMGGTDQVLERDRRDSLLDFPAVALWTRGQTLMALGRHEEALRCFDESLTLDLSTVPGWVDERLTPEELAEWQQLMRQTSLCYKAQCLGIVDRYSEALSCLDQARADDFAPWWAMRANALANLDKPQAAVLECLDRAIELEPKSASYRELRASCLYALGRTVEALASADQAIALDPRACGCWMTKGSILKYESAGSPAVRAEALSCLDKAVALDPFSPEAWCSKGEALSAFDRDEEALASFARAIELDPAYLDSHSGMGGALQGLGREVEALKEFEKCVRLEPASAQAWVAKGNSLMHLGRLREAISCADKALQLDPKNPGGWWVKGTALNQGGRYADALPFLEEALRLDPDDPGTLNNHGQALMSVGRLWDAQRSFKRATELDPTGAVAWHNLGVLAMMENDASKALPLLVKCLAIDSTCAPAWYKRGVCETTLGQVWSARHSLETYLKLAPSGDRKERKLAKQILSELS